VTGRAPAPFRGLGPGGGRVRARSISAGSYVPLKDATMRLDGLTALIALNGSGKTSVLGALELFSADAPPVTLRDLNDRGDNMEAVLSLSAAGAGEKLAPYAVGGEIRLRRVYGPGDPEKPPVRLAQKTTFSQGTTPTLAR